MSRFTHQNQMEYFDADYSEELIKNVFRRFFPTNPIYQTSF